VKRPGGKVVILGGGMAGLSAAWRLSEPGWRDRFDSITVYQRGWRLGGKGASSRGENGRIEEHGLHIWLGSYENAFGMLRECYAELDRPTTDPTAPITTWDQALIPGDNLGLADELGNEWLMWLGTFTRNGGLPGEPDSTGREQTVVEFTQRAIRLVRDFAESMRDALPVGLSLSTSPDPPVPQTRAIDAIGYAALAALTSLADSQASRLAVPDALEHALEAVRDVLDIENRPDHKRSWLLLSLMTAVIRGILADKVVTDPRGFRAINDEDFNDWIQRHGAHPDVLDFALVRGLYDLVFGYIDADPERPSFGAGLAVFLTGLVLFQYKGAIFWKMTAGMGDVIIAPMYQALHRRGVEFEFFHRLDALHLDEGRLAVDAITLGRQVRLADGRDHYEPLTSVRGLPVFPSAPLVDQLAQPTTPTGGWHSLETHWADRDDVETRRLRRGVDFDHVVLAVSVGMLPIVAEELIDDRPEWRDMTTHIRTVATQAFQIWLRPDEPTLGWREPGVTISAYLRPFETWASMPQTLWTEDWPADDRPGTVAYFCGTLNAPWPTTEKGPGYARRHEQVVRRAAAEYIDSNLGPYFPGAVTANGFNWHLLSGVNGERGEPALATQHVSVNVDPSDRYVQSIPGTERYRLRPDESGYDNLILAGDWTDSGMNAGCIEAAAMSGLEAANAVLGRSRFHRVRGYYMP
jgi:uncharacterized protein with NAD-binding domain and iron-sulfur cluster